MALAAGEARAATLFGSVNTTPPASVNLTTDGSLDWAVWDYKDGTSIATTVAAKNTIASSPGIISSLSSATGASLRSSSGTNSGELFSYTNGNSPTTLTSAVQGALFSSTLGSSGIGTAGMKLTLQGDTNALRTVNIWTTGFDATGTMTATLNGATTVVLPSQSFGNAAPLSDALFSFTYKPDSASDTLNLSFLMSAISNSDVNAHVSIQAVTVSLAAVPEPSRALLCLVGFSGLLLRRRR